MSDQRLRELERRWTETRDPGDEAAFLRASLRAGALTRERLELAGLLDHPAALEALEARPHSHDLRGLLAALVPHGHEAVIRAGIALLRPLVERWSIELPEDARVAAALAAAERWLEDPGPATVAAARDAAAEARRAAEEGHDNVVDTWQHYFEERREGLREPSTAGTFTIAAVAQGVADAVGNSAETAADVIGGNVPDCFQGVWLDLRDEYGDWVEEGGWAGTVAVESELLDAVRDALVPWALGRVAGPAPAPREVDPEQLAPEARALLAYCGGADAPRELEAWVRGLDRWGRQALAVAALAVADTVQQYWEDDHDTRPRAALRAVAVWITRPGEENLDAALEALDGAVDAMTETASLTRKKRGATPHCAAEAAARVIEVVCEDDPAEAAWSVVQAARVGLSPRRLREVMQEGLSEWAGT